MHEWDVGCLDLDALERLAELLALYAGRGDLMLLEGDLGAGKSTFARALIRAVTGNAAEEVPSPTFALVQSYQSPRHTVHHFDLYRLSGPAEVGDIGFGEALDTGLTLVEWPDRAVGLLGADCLRLVLSDAADPGHRKVKLIGEGVFGRRLRHIEKVRRFIAANGWAEARIAYVAGDASRRSYARLTEAGRTCLLMDSPPLPGGPPVMDGKPYWALARLARDVRAFVSVQADLRGFAFSVPAILAQDLDAGLLLVEDFGERSFAVAIADGVPMRTLYRAAADVLVELSRHPAPASLPTFDTGALLVEARLLVEWYWPYTQGYLAPQAISDSFDLAWQRVLAPLGNHPRSWVLRDFHSPNLFWMPERQGLNRVGLIDFQDAVAGHQAYDLAALLQDARIDVPESLERELLTHYASARTRRDPTFDGAAFRHVYALLGAQRTTKILGIFVRLAKRDGKPAYLTHLPRIKRYLARNLANPGLAELTAWYRQHLAL